MSDATPSGLDQAKRSSSSVLFALGQLSADTANQNKEIAAIPDRVFEKMNPRLIIVEGRLDAHEKRLLGLEKQRWVVAGGSAAVMAVISIGTALHHFRLLA